MPRRRDETNDAIRKAAASNGDGVVEESIEESNEESIIDELIEEWDETPVPVSIIPGMWSGPGAIYRTLKNETRTPIPDPGIWAFGVPITKRITDRPREVAAVTHQGHGDLPPRRPLGNGDRYKIDDATWAKVVRSFQRRPALSDESHADLLNLPGVVTAAVWDELMEG